MAKLTAIERTVRSMDLRMRSPAWLSRRLPRELSRYSLKVGGPPGGSRARREQALEEARRLGWLVSPDEQAAGRFRRPRRKPVMDD
jgi:hypothetical protein